jgi:ribonuclease HI
MGKKYYAVYRGRTPGIYNTWKECQEQINGFPYTEYKGFEKLEDAQEFLKYGRDGPTSNTNIAINKTTAKQLPVCKNSTAKKTIKNVKQNSLINDKEMQKLFNDTPSPCSSAMTKQTRKPIKEDSLINDKEMQKLFNDKPSFGTAGKPIKVKAKSIKALEIETRNDEHNLFVFTDGSCMGNGKINAKGGIGVYFPNKEFTDISEKLLVNGKSTNNQAELMAIRVALQSIKPYRMYFNNIYIITDSTYCIDSLTKNVYNWIKNKWKKSTGDNVLNKELMESTYNILQEFNNVTFAHINSHTNKKGFYYDGNNKADILAVEGANKR